MKKIILTLMLALGLTACDNKPTEPDNGKPTVKIGVSLPLSGNMAIGGDRVKRGLLMALDEINNQNAKYNYELFIEDNLLENKRLIMQLNKFKFSDKVNAIMSVGNSGGILASEFAENNKLLHVTCSHAENNVPREYTLNHITTLDSYTNKVIDYYRKNNFKRVALFSDNVREVENILDVLKPKLINAGFEIVFEQSVNPGETDLYMLIEKMKKTNHMMFTIFIKCFIRICLMTFTINLLNTITSTC